MRRPDSVGMMNDPCRKVTVRWAWPCKRALVQGLTTRIQIHISIAEVMALGAPHRTAPVIELPCLSGPPPARSALEVSSRASYINDTRSCSPHRLQAALALKGVSQVGAHRPHDTTEIAGNLTKKLNVSYPIPCRLHTRTYFSHHTTQGERVYLGYLCRPRETPAHAQSEADS